MTARKETAVHDHRKSIGDWLSAANHEWRIPVYQRHYAWKAETDFGPTQLFWKIVKEQTEARLNGKKVPPHYFGAVLVENKSTPPAALKIYDVVDGQQRLITVHIVLFAIVYIARHDQSGLHESLQEKLAKYVFNDAANRKYPKLVPNNFDKTQFSALLRQAFAGEYEPAINPEASQQSKIHDASNFVSDKIDKLLADYEDRPGEVFDALIETLLDGFDLVLIELRDTDQANLVFESLNNTSTPLTTFDLIRNNVLYRSASSQHYGKRGADKKLFWSPLWQQFEQSFWECAPGKNEPPKKANAIVNIEVYIARMLIAKTEKSVTTDRNAIFKAYKEFAEALQVPAAEEVKQISEYVDVYKQLVEAENAPISRRLDYGCFMYSVLGQTTLYPVIFKIAKCNASQADKQRMISLLQSWVMRRHVCGLPESDYHKFAARLCKAIGNEFDYEQLHGILSQQEDPYNRFPNADDVESACVNGDFYAKKLKRYIFERIACHYEPESQAASGWLALDRIMPQEWRDKSGWKKVAEAWKEAAVKDDAEVDRIINTIGNLTLMDGSLKGNRDWESQDGAKGHLAKCSLPISNKLAEIPQWNFAEINKRAKDLAKAICEIWPVDIK